MTAFAATPDFAQSLDAKDALAAYRDQFFFPMDDAGQPDVYVCGNSLGLQPKLATQYVEDVLSDWAHLGVAGHFDAAKPWLAYHRLATEGFAALTGAKRHEVVAMNTLTVNLHVLMASFFRPEGSRHKIVIESTAFPSDYFVVVSQLRLHGLDPADCLIEWRPRDDELLYTEDLGEILAERGDEIALMLLPGVQYYSGQVLDMAAICELARSAGCAIGLDLAHAIGNVPLQLNEWAPDFAAWCTYKYLNAGPGAVAGAFVHSRHLGGDGSAQLAGWWGNDEATRFQMAHKFEPAAGAERWQLSNPPILSLAPVIASLQLFLAAGADALRQKSLLQGAYLRFLLDEALADHVKTITPMHARGCQLSLVITNPKLDARNVYRTLKRLRVTGDWREPDVIRAAPVPLYNSFADVYELSVRLKAAIEETGQR